MVQKVADADEPKDETPAADGVIAEAPLESSPEQEANGEDIEGQDGLDLQEKVTKQTVGANLDKVYEDQKSFAATEKQNALEDDFVDMKNVAGNIDKYSEGNVVKDDPSEEENLGFMDEEEIQPK